MGFNLKDMIIGWDIEIWMEEMLTSFFVTTTGSLRVLF
jgi:hypothetical protein